MPRARRRSRVFLGVPGSSGVAAALGAGAGASSSSANGGGNGSGGSRIRPRISTTSFSRRRSASDVDGGGGFYSSSGHHRPLGAGAFLSPLALLFSAGAAAAAASLFLPAAIIALQATPASAGNYPVLSGARAGGGWASSGQGPKSATAACGLGCTEGACVRAVDPAPYYGGYYGAGTPDTVFPKGYRTEAACLSCRDGCYFLATRPNSWITYCGCKRGCGIVPGGLVTRCAVKGRRLLGGGVGGTIGHKGSVATSPILSGQCGLGPQLDCRPCPVDWYQPLDGFEFAECRPCEPGSSTLGFTGQAQCTNVRNEGDARPIGPRGS